MRSSRRERGSEEKFTMARSGPLRVLEFYSGIGGMRYALEATGVLAKVVEAFEINEIANDVYEHNFKHRPNQGNIQRLTIQQLEKYQADTWLMSPPCQPYTRQGLQRDAEDARATSFLTMLDILPLMSRPPEYLLIENVVGFEHSFTHNKLVSILEKAGFATQEFILTPLQFGIPYSRPRYFCLAKKRTLAFAQPECNGKLLCNPGPLLFSENVNMSSEDPSAAFANFASEMEKPNEPILDPRIMCKAISEYLDPELMCWDETGSNNSNDAAADFEEETKKKQMLYNVPKDLIERWGDAFDVVTPSSRRCCCFTKSYGRYVKGTGSFIITKTGSLDDLIDKSSGKDNSKAMASLTQMGLRYFTPREIANLHSFPEEFSFPDHVSLKQRYALLGNSISVTVVASLLRYLFTAPVL